MNNSGAGVIRLAMYGLALSAVIVIGAGLSVALFERPFQLGPAELNEPLRFPVTEAELALRKALEVEAQRRIDELMSSGEMMRGPRSDYFRAHSIFTLLGIFFVCCVALVKRPSWTWFGMVLAPHFVLSLLLLVSALG